MERTTIAAHLIFELHCDSADYPPDASQAATPLAAAAPGSLEVALSAGLFFASSGLALQRAALRAEPPRTLWSVAMLPLPPPAAASPMAGAAYTLLSGGIALVCSWKVVLHTGSRAVLSGGRGGQQVLLQGGQSPNQHPCSEGTLCGAGALAQG